MVDVEVFGYVVDFFVDWDYFCYWVVDRFYNFVSEYFFRFVEGY